MSIKLGVLPLTVIVEGIIAQDEVSETVSRRQWWNYILFRVSGSDQSHPAAGGFSFTIFGQAHQRNVHCSSPPPGARWV